jgi:hypothetical protein
LTRHQRFEIRIAGFGGQGVVTIGRILGTAFSVYGGFAYFDTADKCGVTLLVRQSPPAK